MTAVVSQVGTRSSPQDIQAFIELGNYVYFTHSYPALIGMLMCCHDNAIKSHVHKRVQCHADCHTLEWEVSSKGRAEHSLLSSRLHARA